MTGGVINSVNTSYLSNKDVDRIFTEKMAAYPSEFTKFTKTSTSKDRYIKEAEMGVFGILAEKPEGAAKTLQSLKQGNTKTITFKNYAVACVATEEAKDWDGVGYLGRIPEFFAASASYSKELGAVDLFTSAFVTTTRTGIDGKALCASDHTILDPYTGASASTFDNLGTAATLSASTVAEARDYFENLKNSSGLPVQAGRRLLLVIPSGLRDTAKLLLENEYEVNSTDRNLNVNRDTMSYMVSHYLAPTSTAYFFLDLDIMDLRHVVSKPFVTKSWMDNWTDNDVYSITGRWAFDFVSAYGVYGSAGA